MRFLISGWSRCRYNVVSLITWFEFMAPSTRITTALQCIDPKLYTKYQNPTSSSSQEIMLTRFFCFYNAGVVKGA